MGVRCQYMQICMHVLVMFGNVNSKCWNTILLTTCSWKIPNFFKCALRARRYARAATRLAATQPSGSQQPTHKIRSWDLLCCEPLPVGAIVPYSRCRYGFSHLQTGQSYVARSRYVQDYNPVLLAMMQSFGSPAFFVTMTE